MRALVTGVAGFAGSYLAELLLSQGMEVCGLVQPGAPVRNLEGIRQASGSEAGLRLVETDILFGEELLPIVRECCPDRVFHLAAAASVRRSLDDPSEAFQVNVLGTRNLLEAIRRAGIEPRILVVSSADAYGQSASLPRPLQEDDPLLPVSPYGASKAAAEVVATRYVEVYGFQVIRVRPFPHFGPRQAPLFALPDWARQLAEIETGQRPARLRVGNLSVRRDLSDVRDVVRAYTLAADLGESGAVYNVCSGRVFGLREVLNALIRLTHLEVEILEDSQRLRPHDLEVLMGSPAALRARTGWEAVIPIETTLQDLFNSCRREQHPEASPSLRKDL
jgi:GDP-4-dehydro-6-deoxy-D-mannose reductase